MPYKEESMLMATGGDAPEDMTTELCFNPPEGPFDDKNVVMGEIGHVGDEDWIVIKLTAGMKYTITVTGTKSGSTDPLDTVLKLKDAKGNDILMNDDYKDEDGTLMLGSQIEFTPTHGDGTEVYFLSVSGYTGNPVVENTGEYSVSVKEEATLAVGTGPAITGTAGIDKINGTDLSETITGLAGSDTIYGNGGNDTIDGGDGDDFIAGGKGADSLTGGGGEDTISYMYSSAGVSINLRAGTAIGGEAEGDTFEGFENVQGSMHDDVLTGSRGQNAANKLWGLDGNDELFGGRGMDELYGGGGDDVLDGGEDDDTLEGGPGADELTGGGAGANGDTASYAGSMMGVIVRLHSGQAMGGDAEGDTWGKMVTVEYDNPDPEAEADEKTLEEMVPDIANLTGSAHADVLAGDSRVNVIEGGGGDDRLYGGPGGGDDELHGQDGNDVLFGGIGNDMLNGGDGNDTFWGNGGRDTYIGGKGDDIFHADFTIVDTTSTVDDIRESEDEGTDTVSFKKLKEGVAAYTLDVNVENLIGTDEDDADLNGNELDNVIEGLDGADNLDGGGNPTDGSMGDTVSYENSDRRVRVDINTGGNISGGHATGDELTGFENIRGSAYDDVLTGNDEVNRLWGLGGDDELIGGAGNDTIEGGAGADEMNGGSPAGSGGSNSDGEVDTLSYANSNAGVSVNLATLSLSGGHAEGDEIVPEVDGFDPDGPDADEEDPVDVSTFENVTGSDHNDRLTGDHRANTLEGGKGDDNLRGLAGVDTLIGGPGPDMLDGGSSLSEGADTPNDDTDDVQHVDIASYVGAMAGVTVNLDSNRGTGGDADGDTLVNIEKVVGSSHDDMFIAGLKADNIDGGGNPAMGAKGDTVSYELSEDGVTVDLTATDGVQSSVDTDNSRDSYAKGDTLVGIENITGSSHDDKLTGDTSANTLIGGAGDDELIGGDEGDMLHGGAGNDTLTGGSGTDTLMGGDGRDTLNGGAGADTLNGGAGDDNLDGGGDVDTFVFSPEDGAGVDIITNFADEDRIDLRAFGIEDASELAGAIRERGGDIVIDLRKFGGGTILIEGAGENLDEWLDIATDDSDTTNVDETQDGVVQMLSVVDDPMDAADTGAFIL